MANDEVLHYLQSTNRPYSVNDIVQNMHSKYGKPAVQKSLDTLVEQDFVLEKLYGKQKIYCVKQPDNDPSEDSELKNMEFETTQIVQNLMNVEHQAKEAENNAKDLLTEPTTLEAKTQLTNYEERLLALKSKILRLSETTLLVSNEERNKIKSVYDSVFKEYKKRKRMFFDITNAIMEGYPKTKRALFEEVGVETDEDVKMPDIP